MQTAPIRSLCNVLGFTTVFLWTSAFPVWAQGDCKVLEKVLADASSKLQNTPAHVYTTSKIGNQTITSEMIYAGGSLYMKISGKWTSAGSIKEMEQLQQQFKHNANSKDTCRYLRDELVNGEMAAVYSSHSETPKGKIDLQLWVSKATGLFLRQEMDSEGGKAVMSSRYEYDNVKPPL